MPGLPDARLVRYVRALGPTALMRRRLVAILLVPVGVLAGAWLGQYVFPETALGQEFLIDESGGRGGPSGRAQLPALVYFLPTKLSIPLALGGYVVTLVAGAPLAALLAKHIRFSLMVASLLGGLLGATSAWTAASLLMSVASAFGPKVVELGAFIGAFAGAWYWLTGYCGSAPTDPGSSRRIQT